MGFPYANIDSGGHMEARWVLYSTAANCYFPEKVMYVYLTLNFENRYMVATLHTVLGVKMERSTA